MKTKSILFLISTTLLFIAACTKEGAKGPSGTNGLNGKDGNANVYYSRWNTLSHTWRDTTMDGSMIKYNTDSAYGITPAILDSGAVLAYMRFGNGTFPLPYTSFAGGIGNTLNYLPGSKTITYTRFTFDNSGSIGVSSSLQFRYIAIPGGILVGKRDIRTMPYEEVCRLYNIPL